MASVPSARHTRALPLVPGRIPVSAVSGRNCFAVLPSGRIGGLRERELWRYASSAGDKSVCWAIVTALPCVGYGEISGGYYQGAICSGSGAVVEWQLCRSGLLKQGFWTGTKSCVYQLT